MIERDEEIRIACDSPEQALRFAGIPETETARVRDTGERTRDGDITIYAVRVANK